MKAPEDVKGYNKLSEANQKLFTTFLTNFYVAWENPKEHQPVKVEFITEENYIKATFADTWLHVSGNGESWY